VHAQLQRGHSAQVPPPPSLPPPLQVQPLCVFPVIDEGELDYKVVAISKGDHMAHVVKNAGDVDRWATPEEEAEEHGSGAHISRRYSTVHYTAPWLLLSLACRYLPGKLSQIRAWLGGLADGQQCLDVAQQVRTVCVHSCAAPRTTFAHSLSFASRPPLRSSVRHTHRTRG